MPDSYLRIPEELPALWPSAEYDRQIENLRAAIGEPIYVVELRLDDLHLCAQYSGKAFELLDVIEFPKPDPSQRLFPHMLLLEDGRGINLGRVLRVSRQQAYAPETMNRLFGDEALEKSLLWNERRLSRDSIRVTARRQLGELLGRSGLALRQKPDNETKEQ